MPECSSSCPRRLLTAPSYRPRSNRTDTNRRAWPVTDRNRGSWQDRGMTIQGCRRFAVHREPIPGRRRGFGGKYGVAPHSWARRTEPRKLKDPLRSFREPLVEPREEAAPAALGIVVLVGSHVPALLEVHLGAAVP